MDAKKTEKLNKQLVAAAASDNVGRLERLLTEGASLDGTGGFWHKGETALAAAAGSGQTSAIAFLLGKGANREATDADGNTPLMLAVANKRFYSASLLLKGGASTRHLNKAGKSALDIAIAIEHTGLTQLIREHSQAAEAAERQARETTERQARRRAEQAALQARPMEAKPVEIKPVAPPVPVPQPPPKKEDPDIVIFRQQAGDRLLEDVFNFVSFERVTLIRRERGAPVEAMTRQGFSDVESRDYLKKAFTEHLRRGGTVKEDDIFAATKPKISKLQESTP